MSYPRRSLNRRECLHTLSASALALLISSPSRPATPAETDEHRWLREFASTQNLEVLRALGKSYLCLRPDEGSLPLLLPLLLPASDASFAARLRQSISEDWQAHRVVTLDGWISARTEARLCAFCYLDA